MNPCDDQLSSFLDSDSEHRSKVLALLEKGYSAYSKEIRTLVLKGRGKTYARETKQQFLVQKPRNPATLETFFHSELRDDDPDITLLTTREARKDTRNERKEEAKKRQQEFKEEQASKKRKKEETEEEQPAPRRSPRSLQQSPRSLTRTTPLGGVPGSSNAAS